MSSAGPSRIVWEVGSWKDEIGCLLALRDSRTHLAELPLLIFHIKFSYKLWDVRLCWG